MLLVTGGYYSILNYLDSTEVYLPSAGEWREVPGAALPRPMKSVLVNTLNNRVLLFGNKLICIWFIFNDFIWKVAWTIRIMRTFSSFQNQRKSGQKLGRCHNPVLLAPFLLWALTSIKVIVSSALGLNVKNTLLILSSWSDTYSKSDAGAGLTNWQKQLHWRIN